MSTSTGPTIVVKGLLSMVLWLFCLLLLLFGVAACIAALI